MFEALSDRFDGIFKRLRGRGILREDDVDEVLVGWIIDFVALTRRSRYGMPKINRRCTFPPWPKSCPWICRRGPRKRRAKGREWGPLK